MDRGYVIKHKWHHEGLSIRQIAGDLEVSRNTVRKYLNAEGEPVARLLRFPGYSQTRQKAKDRFAWAGFRFQEQREGHDRRTRPRCTRY